ncbi:MAG: NAD(P)-dependent alcohol dehydrogenase [Thermomicrobiales bacterium]|nr:NAD(P)-dependent alcohol dehydrogenase [Thermomicrobiales bacterium]
MTYETLPDQMRAALAYQWGSPENISIESSPMPTLEPDRVLVKVMAVGLNAADKHLLLGTPYIVRLQHGLRRRKDQRIGHDFAGIVVQMGEECSRLAVGDAVFGVDTGAVAEYVAPREKNLCLKPAAISWEHAAAIPISGCTAFQALDKAGVAPGMHVLIHGGSGGVGTAAVQLAKARGGTVTATCSAANRDLVASLGADTVLDYRARDPLAVTHPYDAILDVGGNLKNRRAANSLVPGGSMIKIGYSGGNWLGPIVQLGTHYAVNIGTAGTMHMFLASTPLDVLEQLIALVSEGKFIPPVERVYPFEQTQEAYTRLVSGRTVGKSVIRIGSDT